MRRRGLNRIGILAIALIVAFGVMGAAYGAWVDEIYITGSFSTSSVDASLACGTCWEEVDDEVTEVEDTDIDCSGGSMTLTITVDDAMEDVDYYCSFTVTNNSSSLPIKITGLNLTGSYTDVVAEIQDLAAGAVIDPSDSVTGKVHIYLTNDTSAGGDLEYTLSVTVARWNE
jgi:hypothetical protein